MLQVFKMGCKGQPHLPMSASERAASGLGRQRLATAGTQPVVKAGTAVLLGLCEPYYAEVMGRPGQLTAS